ncbi:hypothetical protein N781_18145 [Pontibacillus halophilus JSM 076056 = DSM 19796]|uniref:Uncharacterized protein n=1 Tax=Pontibacillus halophilus JSM 076056 = DSM 19796 TaxID=1385510 RepID=A0A0A5I8X5_9BACI|nr:hypothetical protein N781_18145 [Pontibacillus halophilus JSM 076056 = DSM 19796]
MDGISIDESYENDDIVWKGKQEQSFYLLE